MEELKNSQAENQEPEVENFIVNYSDGSQRIIEKGFFCEIQEGPKKPPCRLSWRIVAAAILKRSFLVAFSWA